MLALNIYELEIVPQILLLLALLVAIFGIGVIVVGRRSRKPVITQSGSTEQVTTSSSLRRRLESARSALTGAVTGVLARSAITQETWDELEEALLRADVGVTTTQRVLAPTARTG